MSAATCFENGATAVAFRSQDAAGNVGAASANVVVRLFGDLNADGVVDPTDFVVFRACPGDAAVRRAARNLTHEGAVDHSDIVVLRAYLNMAVSCLAPCVSVSSPFRARTGAPSRTARGSAR